MYKTSNPRRLFFDIETRANPAACALMPDPKAPANLKDPEKIAAAIAVSAHAIERHGEEAVIASQCRDHPNAVLFFNPATGRTAYVCLTEHGFGVAIVDRLDQMVTAYLKNKQHTLNQVARYLQNTGYGLLP